MKQLGEKVRDLFFIREDEAPEVPIEEIEEPVRPAPSAAPPEAGSIDEVKKVMDLIASLPEGAPLEMKRAIVIASLEAFGIRIDRVLASALASQRALDGRARAIDQEIEKQQRLARAVSEERARLKAVAAFFGKA